MPDQYGPYRKFKYNLEDLKKLRDETEQRIEAVKQRTNGCGDYLLSERIKALDEALDIMSR